MNASDPKGKPEQYFDGIMRPKDVMRVVEVGYRTAQRMLREIRKHFGKGARTYVTIIEFSKFTGLSVMFIRNRLFE